MNFNELMTSWKPSKTPDEILKLTTDVLSGSFEFERLSGSLDEMSFQSIHGILNLMGFWTCPASSKYHGNHPGGLAVHCWFLREMLVESGVDSRLATLVSVGHDLCKTKTYAEVWKNVDGECRFCGYRYGNNPHEHLGQHGDASLALSLQLFGLELLAFPDVCAAIRWHMPYKDDEMNFLHRLYEKYPLVRITSVCDAHVCKFEKKVTYPS